MKSTIKIDTNWKNQPVINLQVYQDNADLRDKMLNLFLSTLYPNGRLCFIDSNGFKKSNSEAGEYHYYSIVSINPDHYELLIDELKILIKEREARYNYSTPRTDKDHKERLKKIDFGEAMNY